WRVATGDLPAVQVLELVASRPELPDSPLAFRYEVDGVTDLLRTGDHLRVATRIATDRKLLDAVLLAQPPRVDRTMLPWPVSRWRALFDTATEKTDPVPA